MTTKHWWSEAETISEFNCGGRRSCCYQEDDWWRSDQRHGCGQFPHVSSAVTSCCFISVFQKTQLPDPPVRHLPIKQKHHQHQHHHEFTVSPLHFTVSSLQCQVKVYSLQCKGYSMFYQTHITDFLLGDSSQDGVQLQMFSSCQQLVDGVKLRTVTNVLMDLIDLPQDTADTSQTRQYRSLENVTGVQVLKVQCVEFSDI